MVLRREEILRKAMHLIALAIPFGILFLPKKIGIIILAFSASIFILGDVIRMKNKWIGRIFGQLFGGFLRNEENRHFTGATFLFISGLICYLLFEKSVAFTALSFLILGDAAAALVGIRFGTKRIFGKSFQGSFACFLICLAFWSAFPVVPFWNGLIAAFSTAVFELLPLKINDNLSVPIITGTILTFLPF